MLTKYAFIVASLATLSLAGLTKAESLYFQGFETDTNGWVPETGGTSPGAVTQVQSGTTVANGGIADPNGNPINAYDGNFYAVVTNSPDAYQAGYGNAGYSLLGGNGSTPAPYAGSPLVQSIAVYINPLTATPAASYGAGFWIDSAPSSTDPIDAGHAGYGAEQNFRLFYTGSEVDVEASGEAGYLATISNAGWYTFQFVYSGDGVATDLVQDTLNVLDANGNLVGTDTLPSNSDGETLQNQYLAGPGYLWLPLMQNGFSNNQLAIDDVQAFVTPEPGTFGLLGLSGLLVFAFIRRTRKSRAVAPVAD